MRRVRAYKIPRGGGFTLVELVTVLVILGIVAALGTGFVVSMANSYQQTQARAKLVNKGRVAIEQMSRQLRLALPHSLRVSSSGNCLEFMPIVAGASYTTVLPDAENDAPPTNTVPSSPYITNNGTARHAVVGALGAAEIYTTSQPSSRAATSAISGGPASGISLLANHRFIRNSISQRVYLVGDPLRFCVDTGTAELRQYSGYGLVTGNINDTAPAGAATAVMAADVGPGGTAFSLSPGSEDRNTAIFISLNFRQGGEAVSLNHQVLVRNVP